MVAVGIEDHVLGPGPGLEEFCGLEPVGLADDEADAGGYVGESERDSANGGEEAQGANRADELREDVGAAVACGVEDGDVAEAEACGGR